MSPFARIQVGSHQFFEFEVILGDRIMSKSEPYRTRIISKYGDEGARVYGAFRADLIISSAMALLATILIVVSQLRNALGMIAIIMLAGAITPVVLAWTKVKILRTFTRR